MPLILAGAGLFLSLGYFSKEFGDATVDTSNSVIKLSVSTLVLYLIYLKIKK